MQDMWPSGPVGDLCERKTEGQDRIQHGTTSTDGKILCQKRYPMFVGMQMVLQNVHNNRQVGKTLIRIVCSASSGVFEW